MGERTAPLNVRDVDGTEYVYYLRRGDLIKIGYTARLAARMRTLQPDELLAVEPGNRMIERGRHQQFAEFHVADADGLEWFVAAPELLDHIAQVASTHDTPVLPPKPEPFTPQDADPEISDEQLVAEIAQAEEMCRLAPIHSGRCVAELKRRGFSWSQLVKLTGVPQTTLWHRAQKYL